MMFCTFVARSVLFVSIRFVSIRIVVWIHVEEPIALYLVAVTAHIGQVAPFRCYTEPGFEDYTLLACELPLLRYKVVWVQVLFVLSPDSYSYTRVTVPAVHYLNMHYPEWQRMVGIAPRTLA